MYIIKNYDIRDVLYASCIYILLKLILIPPFTERAIHIARGYFCLQIVFSHYAVSFFFFFFFVGQAIELDSFSS